MKYFNWFILSLQVIFTIQTVLTGRCREDQSQCFNGECISIDKRHDLIADCKDKSDLVIGAGCLARHDFSGDSYFETNPGRMISKEGHKCSSYCTKYYGRDGITCDVNRTRRYCHVPYCNILNSDHRVVCDFSTSFCGWTLRSNATVQRWISEGSGAVIKISGQGTTRTSIVSPFKDSRYRSYELTYSVNKSRNCIWDFQTSGGGIPSLWNRKNCTKCTLVVSYTRMISLFLWISGQNSYELHLKLSTREKQDAIAEKGCPRGQFQCDGSCRDLSIFQDGVRDCRFGDEGRVRRNRECSKSEIRCEGSGKCIPKTSPPSFKAQCSSSQKAFPYQPTETKCPSAYICRRGMRDDPRGTICITEEEICDGIPQCPYWDDEATCPQSYCPSECMKCSNYTYKCLPSAILDIPSDAIEIDVSGKNVNLTELCVISRPRLLSLNISSCNLSDIQCLSSAFPNLIHLDASYNNLDFPFINQHDALSVILDGNPIKAIQFPCPRMILNHLSLQNSGLKTIYNVHSVRGFRTDMYFRDNIHAKASNRGSINIFHIDFRDNELESTSFLDRVNAHIRSVDVSRNKIVNLTHTSSLKRVQNVIAHDNLLTSISDSSFSSMIKLEVLDLSMNRITNITQNAFNRNGHLRELYLQRNLLKTLRSSYFVNLVYLEVLRLDDNSIEYLPTDMFSGQTSLSILNLKNNRIAIIPKGLFRNMPLLKYLDLRENDIHVYKDMFYGLVLDVLKVDKFSLCCAKPQSVQNEHCRAPTVSMSSCSFLLNSWYIGVYLWYVTILILSGNIHVIYRQWRDKNKSKDWKKVFSIHVASSDLLMGFFIIIICIKDVDNRGWYGYIHDEWPESWLCEALQLLSALYIEISSVLAVIACILILISTFDIKAFKIKLICTVAWVWSTLLAIAYFVINKFTLQGFSASPQICLITPIIYQQRSDVGDGGHAFNWIIVWMIFHSISSLFGLFMEIFNGFRRRSLQQKWDKQLTVTLSAVVIRDLFFCVTGFIQMAVTLPEVFYELALLVIPTCGVAGTLARLFLKPAHELNPDIMEVIQDKPPLGEQSRKGKACVWKVIVVLDPSLKSEVKCNLKASDINVEVSDETDWKRTMRKIKIIRHMIICEAPLQGSDMSRNTSALLIQILKKANGTCISQCSIQSEQQSTCMITSA